MVEGEVGNLDEAQALLGAIEAQPQAVGGEPDRDGLLKWAVRRVNELDPGELLGLGLDAGEQVVEGGAEDWAR